MLDCLILGDSIALGVGQARSGCEVAARVGITSANYLHSVFTTVPKAAASIVISLGVNDDPAASTLDNLRQLRAGLQAGQVTWLLPGLKEDVRRAIQIVAAEHHDRLLDTRAVVGPDHLHPTGAGYRFLAASIGNDSRIKVAHATAATRPTLAANPPRFLPMVQVPAVPASLQGGFPFRTWVQTGLAPPRSFAFRTYPATATR
jgi:hypothetical protein